MSELAGPRSVAGPTPIREVCGTCGGVPHQWVEGDCINVPEHDHRRASVGWLCRPCVRRIERSLNEILELYVDLWAVEPTGSVPDDTDARHGRSPDAPAPMRLEVTALRDSRNGVTATGYLKSDVPYVVGILDAWCRNLAESRELGDVPRDLTGIVGLLQAHGDFIAAQSWVDDYQAEVEWVLRSLRWAHGVTPLDAIAVCMCVDCHCSAKRIVGNCSGMVFPQPGTDPACIRCGREYAKMDLVRLRLNDLRQRPRADAGAS